MCKIFIWILCGLIEIEGIQENGTLSGREITGKNSASKGFTTQAENYPSKSNDCKMDETNLKKPWELLKPIFLQCQFVGLDDTMIL